MFFILVILASGCQPSHQERQYIEISMEAPSEKSLIEDKISWDTPQAWKEELGSGLRLVSFHLDSDREAIDCSIVSLEGMAGTLESNLVRWMGQLGLKDDPESLRKLISEAQTVRTKDGLEAKVFDFMKIMPSLKSSDQTMMAAMLTMDKTTIFVKMTGQFEAVKEHKANFLKLVTSIRQ